MKAPRQALFLALCSILLAGASSAQTQLRAHAQGVNSNTDTLSLGTDYGSQPGLYLGVEMKVSERLGVEVGAAWTEFEQAGNYDIFFASVAVESTVRMMPVTVALDIHLTPHSRHDFYVAPKIGYAFFDDLEIDTQVSLSGFPFPIVPGFPSLLTFSTDLDLPSSSTSIGVDDQMVYGLRLGYDVPIGSGDSWIFSSSLDYMDVDLELSQAAGASQGLDPLAIGLGLSYRF